MAQTLYTPQETDLLEHDGHLPLGYCVDCHKEVVAHMRLGAGPREGQLIFCCVFCDSELMREEEGLKSVSVPDLNARGYRIVAPEAAKLQKEGGQEGGEDDGGCGSCTSGGCSS